MRLRRVAVPLLDPVAGHLAVQRLLRGELRLAAAGFRAFATSLGGTCLGGGLLLVTSETQGLPLELLLTLFDGLVLLGSDDLLAGVAPLGGLLGVLVAGQIEGLAAFFDNLLLLRFIWLSVILTAPIIMAPSACRRLLLIATMATTATLSSWASVPLLNGLGAELAAPLTTSSIIRVSTALLVSVTIFPPTCLPMAPILTLIMSGGDLSAHLLENKCLKTRCINKL